MAVSWVVVGGPPKLPQSQEAELKKKSSLNRVNASISLMSLKCFYILLGFISSLLIVF